MNVVIVTDDDCAVADSNLDKWFDKVRGYQTVCVATTCQLARLRVAHLCGDIRIELIIPREGPGITIDERAKLSSWPEGMLDEYGKLIYKIVRDRK